MDPAQTDASGTSLEQLRAELVALRPFAPEVRRAVDAWLIPEFLWASSALGQRDPLTREQVECFLERDVVGGGHPLDRFLSLERHRDALERVGERAAEDHPADLELLRELHRRLLQGARRRHPPRAGEWREGEAKTPRGGIASPDPAALPQALEALFEGLTTRRGPLQRASWLYYHLDQLRPFDEENGRVCRLMASLELVRGGYPPLVIPPERLQDYVNALTACDRTAPEDERRPLSPRLDVGPLQEFFASCLTPVCERVLRLARGEELPPERLVAEATASQEGLLDELRQSPAVNWRAKAGFEVRSLHRRVEAVARQLSFEGPLYRVALEASEVVPSHRLSGTPLGARLPGADAGVVGTLTLAIVGDEAQAQLRFPPPFRLEVAIAASQMGCRVLLRWQDEAQVADHPGPLRSTEWPQGSLARLFTQAVDERRRRFELLLLDQNLAPDSQRQIRAGLQLKPGEAVKTGRFTRAVLRESVPVDPAVPPASGTPARAAARGLCPGCNRVPTGATLACPDCATAYHEECLTKLGGRCVTQECMSRRARSRAPAPSGREARPRRTTSLDGLTPGEPPLSF